MREPIAPNVTTRIIAMNQKVPPHEMNLNHVSDHVRWFYVIHVFGVCRTCSDQTLKYTFSYEDTVKGSHNCLMFSFIPSPEPAP
jgi:hypothetical protein